MGKKNSNVVPINPEISGYLEALEIFKGLPSFPTLMNLMHKALDSNVGFEQIYMEIGRLIDVDRDQFYSASGSRTLRKHYDLFKSLGDYNPHTTDPILIADVLWKFITRIKFSDLITSKTALVNYLDWNELGIEEPFKEEVVKTDEDIEFSESLRKVMDGAIDAIIKQEKISKEFVDSAKQDNLGMFPWAHLIKDVLEQRGELKDTLIDFSDYLSEYFKPRDELVVPDLGIYSKPIEVSSQNKIYIVKIVAVILFKNLVQEHVFKSGQISAKTFNADRIQYFSDIENIEGVSPKIDYLIAISNLLMISSVLDINGVAESIFTREELDREFHLLLDAETYDDLSILFLPKSAIPSVIENINPWEGERPEELNFGDLFVKLSYGKLSSIDGDDLDEYLEIIFSGIDPNLEIDLKKVIKSNISKWIIPLYSASRISHLCVDYDLLDYEVVSDRISRALKKSDDSSDDACVFLMKDLEEVNTPIWHSSRSHPAIFARALSSHTNSIEYRPTTWHDLISALDNVGQYRFANGLAAAMILIQGLIHYYSPDTKEKLPPGKTSSTLKKLSTYKDFNLVETSMSDFFEFYKKAPAIYKGSLGSFLPKTKLKLVSSTTVEQDKIIVIKKELIAKGINLDVLEPIASELIAKGYVLSRDVSFKKFDLSLNALNNYLMAIEGELRARIKTIDKSLVEELSYKNIDVAAKFKGDSKQSSIKGLISIAKILQAYGSLSQAAQTKLNALRNLAEHSEINAFTSAIYRLTSIRNPINHGDLDSLKPSNIQISLIDLEKILFENGFLKILCDSK